MNDVHVHCNNRSVKRLLKKVLTKLGEIMSTQAEHAQQLVAIKDQLDKAKGEIVTKISDLITAVEAAGNTTPEVEAAKAALQEVAQGLDDIVPDLT